MVEKRSGKIGLSDRKIAAYSFTSVNIFYSIKFYALGCMQENFPVFFFLYIIILLRTMNEE